MPDKVRMYARLIPAVSANAAARDDEIFGVRTARTNGISHSLLCGRFPLTPRILAVPCRHRGVPAHCCISALRAAHFRHTRRQRCSSVIQTAPRHLAYSRRHRADLSRALTLQACPAAVLSVHGFRRILSPCVLQKIKSRLSEKESRDFFICQG